MGDEAKTTVPAEFFDMLLEDAEPVPNEPLERAAARARVTVVRVD